MGEDDVERRDEDQDRFPDIYNDQSVENTLDATGEDILVGLTQFDIEYNTLQNDNVLFNHYEQKAPCPSSS